MPINGYQVLFIVDNSRQLKQGENETYRVLVRIGGFLFCFVFLPTSRLALLLSSSICFLGIYQENAGVLPGRLIFVVSIEL